MSAINVIEQLKEKVEQLIVRYDELDARLKKSLNSEQELKKDNYQLREKVKDLEKRLGKELLKSGLGSTTHINNLIREIDKCIALVNAESYAN